jgi:pyridinium-3,5-biscarboxylic acid mononucleotide sulfurtransferase
MDTQDKRRLVEEDLANRDSLIVSFSGGVDSGLLAALAHRVLGDKARCIILDSPLVPRKAVREAQETAERIGIACEVVPFPIMDHEEFKKNPKNRCYYCKVVSSRLLRERTRETGCACIVDGVNCSDLGEHRPGLAASTEEGIVHPFIEAGISKADIRDIAREAGLEFWKKPSAACLASRIPYDEEITPEKLRMIEDAEEALHDRGFTQVRIRLHGTIARLEAIPGEMPRFLRERDEIVSVLKQFGFSYITLDLEGYRSGSMDEVL